MKNYLIPAIGIIITTLILVVINEFTETTFIKDYALLLIMPQWYWAYGESGRGFLEQGGWVLGITLS